MKTATLRADLTEPEVDEEHLRDYKTGSAGTVLRRETERNICPHLHPQELLQVWLTGALTSDMRACLSSVHELFQSSCRSRALHIIRDVSFLILILSLNLTVNSILNFTWQCKYYFRNSVDTHSDV